MLDGSLLAAGDGFRVAEVRCADAGHGLVFVCRGAFIRCVEGREVLLDSTVAYLTAPGAVQRFDHPVPGGDSSIVIRLSPGLLAALAGGDPEPTSRC